MGAGDLVRPEVDRPTPPEATEATGEQLAGPTLTVVLPAYNEADSIEGTVRTVAEALGDLDQAYEIIVVDDGSEDDTRAALRSLAVEFPAVGFVPNDENNGKGHAIRDGCRAAGGEYVLILDADGDLRPDQIEAFLARARRDDADVVVGSKRHPDSEVSYPVGRQVLSTSYARLVRLLFGLEVSDTQVGMKLLREEAVESVMPLLLVEGYAFDAELLALSRSRGFEIAEAPVTLEFGGDSGVDWLSVGRIVRDTFRVFCRLRVLGSYEKIDRAVSYVRDDGDAVSAGRSN